MPNPILPADLKVKLSPSLIVRASYSALVRERFSVAELQFLSDHAPHLLAPLAEMGATDATNRTRHAAYAAAGHQVEEREPWEGPPYATETARNFINRHINTPEGARLRKRSQAVEEYLNS